MSPTLSTLSLETLIQIFISISDVKTLSAAVRSSSHLHRAYLISREVIFTTVTLRELEKRGIGFWEPLLYAEYSYELRENSGSEFHDIEISLISFSTCQLLSKHILIRSNEQIY